MVMTSHESPEDRTSHVLFAVRQERARQEQLCAEGRFSHTCASTALTPPQKLAILVEEVGEAARATIEFEGLCSDKHGKNLRSELVQVAAVAVAWAESLAY